MHTPVGQHVPVPETWSAILLVEDAVLIRLATAEALREAGFLVLEAANADEALTVLRGSTVIDVVVTDIRMPGAIDGLDLAQTVRATWPKLKIVIVSGDPLHERPPAPVDASFGKPVDAARLISCLKQIVARCTP